LQISALVPEIFKFEKCVKYANETANDAIHSTQYYIKWRPYKQQRSLKLGSPIVLQATHMAKKIMFPWQLILFQSSLT